VQSGITGRDMEKHFLVDNLNLYMYWNWFADIIQMEAPVGGPNDSVSKNDQQAFMDKKVMTRFLG